MSLDSFPVNRSLKTKPQHSKGSGHNSALKTVEAIDLAHLNYITRTTDFIKKINSYPCSMQLRSIKNDLTHSTSILLGNSTYRIVKTTRLNSWNTWNGH